MPGGGKETATQRRAREKAETAKKAKQDEKVRVKAEKIALKSRDDAAKVLAESEATLAGLVAGGAGAVGVATGVAGSAGAAAAAEKARVAAEHAVALASMPPFNRMQLVTNTSTAHALTGLFPAHMQQDGVEQPDNLGIWIANALFQMFQGEEVTLPKISRMIVEVTMPGGAGRSVYQAQGQVAESAHYVPMMQALVSELYAGALDAVPDGVTDDVLFGALELIFKHNRTVTAPTWGGVSRGDQSFSEDRNVPFAKILEAIAYKEVTPAAKPYGMIDFEQGNDGLEVAEFCVGY